jgi:hypothetical protein
MGNSKSVASDPKVQREMINVKWFLLCNLTSYRRASVRQVQQLIDMGFRKDDAKAALQRANGVPSASVRSVNAVTG